MASQSENSVSLEFGELLELLNALEAQDSRPLENFATLERLLAAGKIAPAESSFEDAQSEIDAGTPVFNLGFGPFVFAPVRDLLLNPLAA